MLAASDFRENVVITGTSDSIWDFSDLMRIPLRGDSVQGFNSKRDEVLQSMKKISENGILEIFIQDETRRFRTTEVYHDIVQSRYSAKTRRIQLHSTERNGTQIPGTENKDRNFDVGMTKRLNELH